MENEKPSILNSKNKKANLEEVVEKAHQEDCEVQRERVSVVNIFLDEILNSNTSSIATHLEYLVSIDYAFISLISTETQMSVDNFDFKQIHFPHVTLQKVTGQPT